MSEMAETVRRIVQTKKRSDFDLENLKEKGDIYLEDSLTVMSQKDFFVVKFFYNRDSTTYFCRSDREACTVSNNRYKPVLHRHDYIEMTYVVSGILTQYIGNDKVDLKKGEICIVDQNCIHREEVPQGDGTVLFLCFSTRFFDSNILNNETHAEVQKFISLCLNDKKKLSQYIYLKPYVSTDDVERILVQFVQEIHYQNIGYQYMLKALTMRLFEILSRQYDCSLNTNAKGSRTHTFYLVEQYMKGNLTEVTITDLERRFHFGKNYFNQLIMSQTGLTYIQYLQKLRMEEAAYLLLQTDFSISEISNKVGYSNRSHFYKLFDACFHNTPKEYRENYRI